MNDREYRRERIIDEAIAAGKFNEGRREHYRQVWERDPEGAERLVASLAGIPDVVAAGPSERLPGVPPGKEAPFPAPPMNRTEADVQAEHVDAWTSQLFPEVAARKAVRLHLVQDDE